MDLPLCQVSRELSMQMASVQDGHFGQAPIDALQTITGMDSSVRKRHFK